LLSSRAERPIKRRCFKLEAHAFRDERVVIAHPFGRWNNVPAASKKITFSTRGSIGTQGLNVAAQGTQARRARGKLFVSERSVTA
jgi:hypothetical protein